MDKIQSHASLFHCRAGYLMLFCMVEFSFMEMIYGNVISIWQTVTGNNVASPLKIDLCYTTEIF